MRTTTMCEQDIPSVRIIISYHKKDVLLKDEILTPINAGRTNAKTNNNPDLLWLFENTIGDDSGENISHKNAWYNEMTSIYWAWKNYQEIGNPDYIGHMHYRRHLLFNGGSKSVYELGNLEENYLNELGYSLEKVKKLCRNADLVVPSPQWRISAYEFFKRNFDISELDTAVSILKKKYPQYSEAANKYLDGSDLYFCNIFIMRKEIFFEYAEFIFSILEDFENHFDMKNGRRMFVSEWISGIFIQKKIDEKKKTTFLPTAIAEAGVTIPVVFASDNNYAMQMAVAITSLLKNAKHAIYDIRCLISDDFSKKNKDKILSIQDVYQKCEISFTEIPESLFANVKIKTTHLSKVGFYRLLVADIFPDLNKIIYLDVDVIVLQDLSVFYRYSLDTQYIGGVRAPGYYFPDNWRESKEEELGIKIDQYVNSGVLLMNLSRIRKDNLTNKFIQLSKNDYRSEDQDILNIACYNNIRHIPFRFNVQTKYTDPKSEEKYKFENVIPKDERDGADKNPIIIHYAGKTKPWNDCTVWKSEIWFKYFDDSSFIKDISQKAVIRQSMILALRKKTKEVRDGFKTNIDKIRVIPDNYTPNMNEEYKVSVIIPCYNAEKYLHEALESAILQSASLQVEIICVDDGSTDKTLNLLCAYAEQFDMMKIFVQPNKGAGAARNLGLKVARGEFVGFLDADDLYPSPTTLENLYFSAVKNDQKICGGCFSSFDGKKINYIYKFPYDSYVFTERKITSFEEYQYDYGYHRFIYDRRLLENNNISFPPYKRFQDPPFLIAAMHAAKTFMAVPEYSYRYRITHKNVGWNEEKVVDLILGITDNLKFSKNKNYPKLHFYNYLHILDHISTIRSLVRDGNTYILLLYVQLIKEINFEFMCEADNYNPKALFASNFAQLLKLAML
ncbi:DUF4422 domain-containing protein [Desulfosarcina sp. OttesenSCG-928-A07]|nr:DUF4422 domain-containing protein [Desulfosarcina sp. OttesenSCG-928-G17]MDL2330244.1 DUF4422 domain-containing protein [Desulfosarcina sp. OttesenSCG-928-A07]